MPDGASLITFIAVSALLGITPGPDIIYVITRGVFQGARAGIAAAAGLATGIIGHTLLCVVGLSAILAASTLAFNVIKIMGAAYLVYLGIRMWRDRDLLNFSDNPKKSTLIQIYRQTIVMNLLNPKVAIFFLAFLPQFVDVSAGAVEFQFAVLGAIFMAVAFVVMSLAGIAGGVIRRTMTGNARVAHWLRLASGGVLVGLGVRLALQSQE
jgi:threonine/homoserine/homoserine lactone efflux protein